MTRRGATAVLLATACLLTAFTAVAPPATARPRCFGRTATIVKAGRHITGTPGDDVIVGGPRNDIISGLGGNDRICAAGGKDSITPGPGRDLVNGGPNPPPVPFSCQSASKSVGDFVSFARGPGVKVSLASGKASGQGRDRLIGIESIVGSKHNDKIWGNEGQNCVFPGGGNDIVTGAGEHDFIRDADGNDDLMGDAGNDLLAGGDGNDTMFGGADDDVIFGDLGLDTADGGEHISGDTCQAETETNCEL